MSSLPLTKILGALTASYAAAVLVQPKVLAGPCELTEPGGGVSRSTAALCRAVGVRDLASGLAMVLAPTTGAARAAIAVRTASDLGDVVVFGTSLPSRSARMKAVVVGIVWGGLCAATALTLD
ncbi:MAG: hypothetical protein ABI181_09610 [Mycobacteriaceae bacterium]